MYRLLACFLGGKYFGTTTYLEIIGIIISTNSEQQLSMPTINSTSNTTIGQ
jgi:hypothetical protein